jgi:hypothetical protein
MVKGKLWKSCQELKSLAATLIELSNLRNLTSDEGGMNTRVSGISIRSHALESLKVTRRRPYLPPEKPSYFSTGHHRCHLDGERTRYFKLSYV